MLPDTDDDRLDPGGDEPAPVEQDGAGVDLESAAASPSLPPPLAPPAPAEDALGPAVAIVDTSTAAFVDEPLTPLTPLTPIAPPAGLPIAAAPPPPAAYVPKPKPPIRPERVIRDSGEVVFRTDGILLERAAGRSWFVTISPPQAAPQRIYVPDHAFDRLVTLAEAPAWDAGRLWRALCEIPLDRPLPSRRLEEELRALLTTFTGELRR